jgi:hypothetical protein
MSPAAGALWRRLLSAPLPGWHFRASDCWAWPSTFARFETPREPGGPTSARRLKHRALGRAERRLGHETIKNNRHGRLRAASPLGRKPDVGMTDARPWKSSQLLAQPPSTVNAVWHSVIRWCATSDPRACTPTPRNANSDLSEFWYCRLSLSERTPFRSRERRHREHRSHSLGELGRGANRT